MKPLLAGLTWDWRVAPSPDAPFTPWAAEIPPLVREWTGERQRVPVPTCWHVSLAPLPSTEESPLSRDNLPASDAPEHALAPDADGLIDLHATLLPAGARCRANRVAVLTAEWTPSADAENLLLLISADWHARLWLDDTLVWDTWASGNRTALDARAYAVPISPLPGNPPRRLRLWVAAGSGGWATRLIATRLIVAPQSEPPPAPVVEARRRFAAPPTSSGSHLAFLGPEPARVLLNGRSLPAHPADGLQRERLDDLPLDLLLPGENELRLRWNGAEALAGLRSLTSRLDPFLALADSTVRAFVLAADLALEDDNDPPAWPPVLVAHAGGLVRVVHTHATRRQPGGPADAPPAHWHRSPAGPLTLRDPARARLVVFGDPAPQPAVWAALAPRLAAERPDLSVCLGDCVSHGRQLQRWGPEFFQPGAPLWLSAPACAVPGNHDEASPFFDAVFADPASGRRDWSLACGSARLLGLDGAADWTPGGSSRVWLEAELAAAREPFILVFSHYPPFSSSNHGRFNEAGQPREAPCRQAALELLPLFARHGVNAWFCGHCHGYERAEPPAGPVVVISGGAGGYLYPASPDATRQSPWSRVYRTANNHVRLEIEAARMSVTAIATDNTVLDRFVLSSRETTV